jgi:UDP-N-acetylglucosamine:LPS N-acetylglucosamine transferase
VAPPETDAASLGTGSGFGISADPDKPEAMVAAVRALLREPERLQSMAAAARDAARDYNRSDEIAHFMKSIEESVSA